MLKGDTPAQDRIDKKQFENLCGLQCTLLEICDFFDVEDDTLNSWCKKTYGTTFSEVFKLKRGKGQISLRRMQWKLAEKNPTMAIFLGKQYLGQKDKIEYSDDGMKSINENINNIANLLNNPKPNRSNKDV